MNTYLQFLLLSILLGNPLLALAVMLVIAWGADRLTVGILPNPVRVFARWKRSGELERRIAQNPNDRRARRELADLLVARRAYRRATDVLKPNLAAGDEDGSTLFLAGVAHLGAGDSELGERCLAVLGATDPRFRMGAVDLELGRFRMARRDYSGAKASLERFVRIRPGSVEGSVLLARALDGANEREEARRVRDRAWAEFKASPFFKRRADRLWAWRARPSRPIVYGILVLAVLIAFVYIG